MLTRRTASLPHSHIKITGLPKSTLPQDVRRLVQTRRLENISTSESAGQPLQPSGEFTHPVFMDYDRFLPTGAAYLKLSSPTSMARNLRALNNATMSSLLLRATAVPDPFNVTRTRGLIGRQEAANRGFIHGDGPSGGTSGSGKNVVVWGLPGKLPPEGLKNYLRAFRLSDKSNQESIVKIEP